MGLFSTAEKTRFKKIKEENCVVTFSVEVPFSELADQSQTLLVRLQQRAKIPGFRPGKAPLDVVKKQFAGHVREEAFDALIRKHVPEAMKDLNIQPVAVPSVEDVSYEEGKPIKFQVRAEVMPAFSPKDYSKIKVTRKNYPVSEEDLNKRIEELREANARLDKASDETVAKNHYVVISYEGFQGGKPLPKAKGENELVDMSSDQTLEGLAEGLVGMKRNDVREVPVKIQGKDSTLKVTVTEIKTKILPPLDAEFAKDLGFEKIEDLQAKLKVVMEDENKHKTEREVSQQIEEALISANKIPLPPSVVQAQLEHMLERLRKQLGLKEFSAKQLEDLKPKMLPRAEDEVRISYLLPAIAEREKIKVLDEDFKAELERNLAAAETEAKKAEIGGMFEERKDSILAMIRDRRTLQFIRDKAVITDA
ncbi:MAG: trigger factor [Elusimicrobia bacterium]|nr:trigger factor [Elusimicrobiota bacterium]